MLIPQSLAFAGCVSLFASFAAAQKGGPAGPTPVERPVAQQVRELIEATHAVGQFSGAALVADGGKVVYRGAFGLANADWAIPNQVDTKFRLASITKQFTAMLTLLLVKDGKLALDAPITRYLKGYPAASGDKVTIHHLLNHTSGIPSYTDNEGFMQRDALHAMPVKAFVAKYCSEPLDFEPGSKFHYNNSGYFLLGAIIEQVTGTRYREVLRARIFEPLGMTESGYDDQYAVLSKRATGYQELLGERRLARWMDMSTPYAAGALYSTIGDLWKWDRALRAKTLLSGELEQKMFTPGHGGYGYGWNIDQRDPKAPIVSHSGGMPGVATVIVRCAAKDRCVILLSNVARSNTRGLARGIAQLLDGEQPPKPKRSLELALARQILDRGVEKGLGWFGQLPERFRGERIEREINGLGYFLLERGRRDDAISLFEFNTRAHPKSANVWDSLGEAQALVGRTEQAIENYGKALALDPKSETAKAALKRLRGQ